MIKREEHDGIRVLRLEHGKANALDLELVTALEAELADAAAHAAARVLTGRNRIFCAGVDLFRLLDGGEDHVREFVPTLDRCFRAMCTHPGPLVAALNGHAIAGGCVIAAAADRRVMAADVGRIGVTELLVGVPFPAVALELVRQLVAPPIAQDLVLTGRTVDAATAQAMGLVDEIVPQAEVLDTALRAARQLAAMPAATFAVTKRQLRAPLLAAVAQTAMLDAEVVARWRDPATHEAIRAYLDGLPKARG
ncbi:MAG: enoyl-CoA hydratase/isomerase family protein [Planctomycetota bacterium]